MKTDNKWLALVLACATLCGGAQAQGTASKKEAAELSDVERAKRDANKVFSFIKFQAVKPAGAPAPAPKAPAPKPAPRPETAVAAAPASVLVAAAPAPVAVASPAAALAVDPRTLPPANEPLATTAPAPEALVAPSPAVAVEEDDDPGVRLVKYVAPELNQRAMAAMTSNTVKVRVRFTVMPDGSAAKVSAVSSAPRPVAMVAVRAVEQWRFEGVKEPQEVEVEVDFKLND